MSTTEATDRPGRPLLAEDSGYVKRDLCREVRTLIDRLRDETSHVDVRLDTLALDVLDELERVEALDKLDRATRHRLFVATLALSEHVEEMAKTASTVHRLAYTISRGWYDADEPED